MYKIIGADQKEYGPVTAEQLRQWLAEGRVSAQTQVLPEGATEWKALGSLPEFAAAAPGPVAGPDRSATRGADAAERVKGPAIGLIVVAVLGALAADSLAHLQFGGRLHPGQQPDAQGSLGQYVLGHDRCGVGHHRHSGQRRSSSSAR